MSVTIDITDYDVFKALRSFIIGLFPDVDVIRTQTNDVPMPKGAFITMNDVGRARLATNIRTYTDETVTDPGTQNTLMKAQHTIQVDFYGPNSAQRAHTFAALYFDYYGYDAFPKDIKPLWCTDPRQMPLIAGEESYIERWRCDAHIQLNAIVKSPMQFFDKASVNIQPPVNYLEDE